VTRLRLAILFLLSALLTACGQMYWAREKSTGTLERFTTDHRECLMATGTAVQDRPGYVVATEQNFRVCMVSRNWRREQWSSWEAPRGRFRGVEDFPQLPISVDSLPEQSPRATEDVNADGYQIPFERCVQCPVP